MPAQWLLLTASAAYIGIRLRIGTLKARARRAGDLERAQRLGAIGFQMMVGGMMLILVMAITAALLAQ